MPPTVLATTEILLMETPATKGPRNHTGALLIPKGSPMTTSYSFNLLKPAGTLRLGSSHLPIQSIELFYGNSYDCEFQS
jgi:hypothetical protein